MAEVQAAKFSCDGCGKTYKWKPEFAGKKVKCKCGFVMTAPAAPPEAPEDGPDMDALFALADEGKQAAKAGAVDVAIRCPSCKSELQPGDAVCPQCGFNLRTGKKASATPAAGPMMAGGGGAAVATAKGGKSTGAAGAFAAFGAPKRGLQKDVPQDFKAIDLYLPIGLLLGGFALTVVQYMHFNPTLEPVTQAVMYAGLKLVIPFVLVAFSSIFLIRFMEMAFGDPALAALKIAAVVIGPAALANIISFLIHDAPPTGWGLVGFFVAFGLFFVLYHYLFEFDMSEKWIIVGVTAIICMIATPMIFQIMLGSSETLAAKGAKNDDAAIKLLFDLGRPKEAKPWLEESNNRMIGEETRAASEELINGLFDAGAKSVWAGVDGPQAAEIYAEMPKDAKKRKAVIDHVTAWNAKHKRGPAEDKGGKWLILPFLPYNHPEPVGF